MNLDGSVKELQVDSAQDICLVCGSSLRRSTSDAPQTVQLRWSHRIYYSGYASPYIIIQIAGSTLIIPKVVAGYGMTELSPAALAMMPPEGFENAGAAGRLLPNLEARLVDGPHRYERLS